LNSRENLAERSQGRESRFVLESDDPDALLLLADVREASGDSNLVIETYKQVLALDPQDPVAAKSLERLTNAD
jgi:predicted TPR repeat methyltransferase